MPAFNVVQRRRRDAIANRKREVHGDPTTGKLHQRIQPQSVSGKRQRKMLKKWRREQKEAVEKGLITMQDVEMAMADAKDANKTPVKFPMKKSSRLRVKQLKKTKGKNKKKSQKPAVEPSVESMVVE